MRDMISLASVMMSVWSLIITHRAHLRMRETERKAQALLRGETFRLVRK